MVERNPHDGGRGAKSLGKEEAELREDVTMTQSMGETSGLTRLREAAKRNRHQRFNNILHHLNPELLRTAYEALNRRAVPGIDRETWQQFGKGLASRLSDLHHQIQAKRYRPKPVKRVQIPKANGEERPLGLTSITDKVVQGALAKVLESIYEEDFLGFSYGFRPHRSAHDALDAVYMAITTKKVSWVLDADIRAFFDRISHDWMMRFIEHRIADKRVHRLLERMLKSEVHGQDGRSKAVAGTPQGAVISPLLGNIYLHYVFDLWAHQWRQRHARGEVYLVRYADDVVVCFQYRSDGERFWRELSERLEQFDLSLNEEKTRLIEFGRFASSNRRERGAGKPETFEFLGFTHQCSARRKDGGFCLRRQTIAKRQRRTLGRIKSVLMAKRHSKVSEVGCWLRRVVQGYFNYYGVPGNTESLDAFRTQVNRYWLRALRRRSHKGASLSWAKFQRLVQTFIPTPRVTHPYPSLRFRV